MVDIYCKNCVESTLAVCSLHWLIDWLIGANWINPGLCLLLLARFHVESWLLCQHQIAKVLRMETSFAPQRKSRRKSTLSRRLPRYVYIGLSNGTTAADSLYFRCRGAQWENVSPGASPKVPSMPGRRKRPVLTWMARKRMAFRSPCTRTRRISCPRSHLWFRLPLRLNYNPMLFHWSLYRRSRPVQPWTRQTNKSNG